MSTIYAYYDSGETVRAVIRDDSGQYADVVNEAMESYDAADIDDYDTEATETGSTGEYRITWPDWLATGLYTVQWIPLAGGAIAESDLPNRFAIDSYYWDGTNVRPVLAVLLDDADAILDAILADTAQLSGAGAIPWTVTVTVSGNPIDGAEVRITSDAAGNTAVAGPTYTDASGEADFLLDAGTYYMWVQVSGYDFTNPTTLTVS